jgi:hypothetical protein
VRTPIFFATHWCVKGPGATVADHQMIGKMGRVTGTVDETIPVGSRIVVVEYFPPRTVVVTRM